MSYTKGAWKALYNDRFWEIAVPWEGESEAHKYSPALGYAWDVGEETAKDNAHLMAAAPDLLEALKACQLQLLQSGDQHDYTHEALQKSYTAIAKAEGRTI